MLSKGLVVEIYEYKLHMIKLILVKYNIIFSLMAQTTPAIQTVDRESVSEESKCP